MGTGFGGRVFDRLEGVWVSVFSIRFSFIFVRRVTMRDRRLMRMFVYTFRSWVSSMIIILYFSSRKFWGVSGVSSSVRSYLFTFIR